MKKVIRLTESDLTRIVRRVIKETHPLEGGPGYMIKHHIGVLKRLISDLENEGTSNLSDENLKDYYKALNHLKDALKGAKGKYKEETGEDI